MYGKDKFNFLIERNYNKDGVKEACCVAREYLSHSKNVQNGIFNEKQSAVSNQKFLSSVELLLAFLLNTDTFFQGEFQLSKSSRSIK